MTTATLLCAATYDEPHRADRSDTHTCDTKDGHDGPHHCETCDSFWVARVGVVPGPTPQREQIALARMDAHLLGTGWVMVTRIEDGTYEYDRIDPVRIELLAPEAAEVDLDLEEAIRRTAKKSIQTIRLREKLGLLVMRGKRRVDEHQGWVSVKQIQELLDGDALAAEARTPKKAGNGKS
jgi:hypothetical protein